MRSIIKIFGSRSYKQIGDPLCCHPQLWFTPMDSLFLCKLPTVSLADVKSKFFIADFPESRPPFEHIKLWVEEWRAQIDKGVTEVMKRKNSAVSCIQVLVDQHGLLVTACFKHPIIVSTAKTALRAIFHRMPK